MGDRSLTYRLLHALAPTLALFASVLFLSLPLPYFGENFPPPLLPLTVVFLFVVFEPDNLLPITTFLAGLLQDFLSGSVLGLWAATYLLLHYAVLTQRSYLLVRGPRMLFIGYLVVAALSLGALFLVQVVILDQFLPLRPLVIQFFITAAAYPIVAHMVARWRAPRGWAQETM